MFTVVLMTYLHIYICKDVKVLLIARMVEALRVVFMALFLLKIRKIDNILSYRSRSYLVKSDVERIDCPGQLGIIGTNLISLLPQPLAVGCNVAGTVNGDSSDVVRIRIRTKDLNQKAYELCASL